MKPIIFLDVDGVLNSHAWFESWDTPEALDRAMREATDWRITHIDPAAVARLRRLVLDADAEIVVSSTWRLGHPSTDPVWRLCHLLSESGFPEAHVRTRSATPVLHGRPRREEIRSWLDDRIAAHGLPSFVILDDDADASVDGHFIRTDELAGLTDADVDEALAILRGDA